MADKAGAGDRRALRRAAAIARRLRQRADRSARLRRARDDGGLRQSPRVGVGRQGCARTAGGRLWPVGGKLRARRAVGDEGARRDLPQRRRGETRLARGRSRSPRSRDSRIGSPESMAKRARPWNARWPCSNPAATTIWPFASDTTRALRRCFISRSRCGRWATSGARFPSSATLRRGLRASPMSARAHRENVRGHVRADASRHVARRNERRRTRPTHARA